MLPSSDVSYTILTRRSCAPSHVNPSLATPTLSSPSPAIAPASASLRFFSLRRSFLLLLLLLPPEPVARSPLLPGIAAEAASGVLGALDPSEGLRLSGPDRPLGDPVDGDWPPRLLLTAQPVAALLPVENNRREGVFSEGCMLVGLGFMFKGMTGG